MSKGWYVKVATQIVVDIDTNIGVLASTEEKAGIVAQDLVSNNLDKLDYVAELDRLISWDFQIGGMEWNRSGHPDIDFDTMQCVFIDPDPDLDPDSDTELEGEDEDEDIKIRNVMEAVQCLNESFHDLPEEHPLHLFRQQYGIAEVRDKLNMLAVYCDMTHRVMVDEQGFDLCFDWDFVPQFLRNCVNPDFTIKSEDPHILSMYWSKIGS